MAIVWDNEKLKTNIAKHGMRFADAASVLEDPNAVTVADHESDAEERFVTLGMDALGRVLVVAYTCAATTSA